MSWFRNLVAYRLTGIQGKALTAAHLAEQLAAHQFQPCGDLEAQRAGFVPPVEGGDLTYAIPGGHIFLALCTEKKNLPKQVVDRMTRDRCRELEEQQGFRPGRKQTKEIRESVIDELLPRTFTTRAITRVWIDPADGWFVIDTASQSRADDVYRALMRALDSLPVCTLRTVYSPAFAMSNWITNDEAPAGFTVDDESELQSLGESRATVRYVRDLPVDDARRHIVNGKQCTRLAMTWRDRVSLVLTDALILKRVAALDVLKENATVETLDAQERRDADLALMCGELRGLLRDVVAALGGEAAA